MLRGTFFGVMALGLSAIMTLCVGCDQKEAQETLEQVEASAGDAAESIKTGASEAVEKGGQMAGDALDKGKEAAGDALEQGKEVAGDAVEKGKQVAAELSEKAAAYLTPIKDEFAKLGDLKDKPEELKAAVSDLIQSIESKAEDIQLPESVSKALATVKEKLVELKDYLDGEVEQAQLDKRLEDITNTVKSGLGMSADSE